MSQNVTISPLGSKGMAQWWKHSPPTIIKGWVQIQAWMPYVGWVRWRTSLLCSERFLYGFSGICLSSKTKGEFDWTYCYKFLVPWFLDRLNATYVGIFYFKQIYRHWNALNAKTNDFWSLFHLFLFWNFVNRTLPNIPKFQFNLEW